MSEPPSFSIPENPPTDSQGVKEWLNAAYKSLSSQRRAESKATAVNVMQRMVVGLRTQRVKVGGDIQKASGELARAAKPAVDDAYRVVEEAAAIKDVLRELVGDLESNVDGEEGAGESRDPLRKIAPIYHAKEKM
eukprot:jgi/Bigna1/80837/fgenesh1_pg.75_\